MLETELKLILKNLLQEFSAVGHHQDHFQDTFFGDDGTTHIKGTEQQSCYSNHHTNFTLNVRSK